MIRYQYANLDGNNVFYREAGPNTAPTILLLHGFPTSSHMFRDLIPELAIAITSSRPIYPALGFRIRPIVDDFATRLIISRKSSAISSRPSLLNALRSTSSIMERRWGYGSP